MSIPTLLEGMLTQPVLAAELFEKITQYKLDVSAGS